MTKRRKKAAPLNVPPPARKLFGTDGIRGVANEPPMTPEVALRLGRAIAFVARRDPRRPVRIVIGKDTRLSGYMLETALAAGICAMGGRVMLSGPIPTPAVAYLTTSMRADAGVVISASHNPFGDNGIKIFGPDGFKLVDDKELEIESLLEDDRLNQANPTGNAIGKAIRLDDAAGRYVVYCKNTFPSSRTLDGVGVVVDAGHGAAYRVAPAVFAELGADVHAIGCRPNGRNINRDAGALHPEHVVTEVKARRASIGIALDGDADRVVVVDEKGKIVDGDVLMALCATRMLRAGRLAKKTLVTTVMSNLGLERAMENAGGKLVRTAVGDRYVVEAMRRGGYNFGGEQSGHLVFLEHASTGDGIVAALQVLEMVIAEQRPLSELAREIMVRVPQVLENVTLPERRPLEKMPLLLALSAKVERALAQKGRLLVRWSGTEPKLRVMVEGEDSARIAAYAKELIAAAQKDMAPRSANGAPRAVKGVRGARAATSRRRFAGSA
jgi:phosphoglucosamine mutase